MHDQNKEFKSGITYAFLAYLGWGFFPIYWKFLKHVPLLQILSHRVIWAFIFYTVVLIYKRHRFVIFKPENRKDLMKLILASVLLMGNWVVYIYAVNSNQIVESSLGYFINPLVNIFIGVIFLKEKLSRNQMIATALAFIGVLIITLDQGHVPIIALFLAITFSIYGLLKKFMKISGLLSNQFESLIMVPVAAIFLLTQDHSWLTPENQIISIVLLVGAGVVTGLPLIFFAEATKRIPYYLIGFFQFLAPTLQFLSGVVIFSEPLSSLKLKGFVFIWLAGALLILNSWWQKRKQPKY